VVPERGFGGFGSTENSRQNRICEKQNLSHTDTGSKCGRQRSGRLNKRSHFGEWELSIQPVAVRRGVFEFAKVLQLAHFFIGVTSWKRFVDFRHVAAISE
jgi:hypothetical protein